MRKFLVITIVLAISSTAFAQLPMGYGGHLVDGNLDDWSGVPALGQPGGWDAFDTMWTQGADQTNNDFGSGEFAVTWTSSGIYVAARITDNQHVFSASGYGGWNTNDFIEIYIDPCNEDFAAILYNGLTGGMQWTMGRDLTPGDWTSLLSSGTAWDAYSAATAGAKGVVNIAANGDLIYEAFIPGVFEQGSRTDYKFGQEIGFEVTMITKFGTTTGPLSGEWQGRHAGNGAPGPFNAAGWTTYTLVPEPFTMSLLGIGGLALLRRRKK